MKHVASSMKPHANRSAFSSSLLSLSGLDKFNSSPGAARKLLQGGMTAITEAPAPLVQPQTLPAKPPPRNNSFGGSALNNNVAFVGVALALGLVVSCCWCGCGAYRRRFANSGQLRYSQSGGGGVLRVIDFGDEQQQYDDVKMTVQPVMVIHPDTSLAYTFRELDPETEAAPAGSSQPASPAAAPGGNSGTEHDMSAPPPLPRNAEQWRPRPSDPIIPLSSLTGGAPSTPEPAISAAAGTQSLPLAPYGDISSFATSMQGQRHIQHIGMPVMLEWDLTAAVDDSDLADTEATKLMLGRAASAKLPHRVPSQGRLAHMGSGSLEGLPPQGSLNRAGNSFRAMSGRLARAASGSSPPPNYQDAEPVATFSQPQSAATSAATSPIQSAATSAATSPFQSAAFSGSSAAPDGASGARAAPAGHNSPAALELQPRYGSRLQN